MAPFKKRSKVRVLVRLRPERSEFKANEKDNRSDMPDQCVRAVDSLTLELWNCRNSEESIRYRWERKTFWLYFVTSDELMAWDSLNRNSSFQYKFVFITSRSAMNYIERCK